MIEIDTNVMVCRGYVVGVVVGRRAGEAQVKYHDPFTQKSIVAWFPLTIVFPTTKELES